MKTVLVLVMLAAGSAKAQDTVTLDVLSVPGVTQAVAEYAKQAKAIGFVDLHGTFGTGGFLPVRTLKDSAGVKYAAAGIGGSIRQGEHAKPLAIVMLDVSAIYRRGEKKWGWWDSHTEKLTLPDFWVGPSLTLVMPGDKVTWSDFGNATTWARYAIFAASVGF